MSTDVVNKQTERQTVAAHAPALGARNGLILTWLVMAAFAVGAIMLSNKVRKLEEQMAYTPPVVVIDFVRLVDSYGVDADPGQLEQRMMETRQQVEALRDAGYLVLDASNVIAAPAAMYLPYDKGD